MAEKLTAKENAVELLDKQLSLHARKGRYGFVVLASATDAYLQVEKDLGITRKLLEVLLKHRFPVHIITKSDLVERDFDLLHAIGEQAILPTNLQHKLSSGVLITFSFSTLDERIASIFEPGATAPTKRLNTLALASKNGFKAGVSLMPLLPYISDSQEHLKTMYSTFRNAGAQYIMPASLTLFGEQPYDSKPLMLRAIKQHYLDLVEVYTKLFHDNFSAQDYQRKVQHTAETLNAEFNIPKRIIAP